MKTLLSTMLPLLPGETPLPMAPEVSLDDGTNCIPQHYLSYQHTKASVENIIAEIDFDPKFVLFVDEDNASIFIQIGIIGKDNYQNIAAQSAEKIVYGRRWRVEAQLPSSEIIQTAFLALTKAREHEVRELFKYTTSDHTNAHNTHVTTPFSCHHDLPLIAMAKITNTSVKRLELTNAQMNDCLKRIRYDHARFELVNCNALSHKQYLLTLSIKPSTNTSLPELLGINEPINLILEDTSEDTLMYAVMDTVLNMNSRYVEESFTFKHFARFSRKHSIQKISALSAKTRVTSAKSIDLEFVNAFANANYEIDSTRVPRISNGKLGSKIHKQLKAFDIQSGILPKGTQ